MNLFKIKLKTGRIIETDDEEVVKLYKNNPSTVNIIEANKNIVLYEQDDFKETNNHIGRVVVVKPKDDYLKSICICPRCGNVLHYEDLIMVDGSYCCERCHNDLYKEIQNDKETNYSLYVKKSNNHEYEPHKYN